MKTRHKSQQLRRLVLEVIACLVDGNVVPIANCGGNITYGSGDQINAVMSAVG